MDPELYQQDQGGLTFTRYELTKAVGGKFGEFSNDSSQFAINHHGGGSHIDPEEAMGNNKGYVYAAVNAIGREAQNIDFRLSQSSDERARIRRAPKNCAFGVDVPRGWRTLPR